MLRKKTRLSVRFEGHEDGGACQIEVEGGKNMKENEEVFNRILKRLETGKKVDEKREVI